jgi:hypothetical protein
MNGVGHDEKAGWGGGMYPEEASSHQLHGTADGVSAALANWSPLRVCRLRARYGSRAIAGHVFLPMNKGSALKEKKTYTANK